MAGEGISNVIAGVSREERALEWTLANSTAGNPDSVLAAIDKYGWEQQMLINVGDVKGAIVDSLVDEVRVRMNARGSANVLHPFATTHVVAPFRTPQTLAEYPIDAPIVFLELGAYIGYSAVRIARKLVGRPNARFFSIEINPANADISTRTIAHAGLSDIAKVLVGSAEAVIPTLATEHNVPSLAFVFIDHWKDRYLPDLKILEASGLLKTNSRLVADNVIFPGAPDYLQYVRAATDRYTSKLFESNIEYSTTVKDGVEYSICK